MPEMKGRILLGAATLILVACYGPVVLDRPLPYYTGGRQEAGTEGGDERKKDLYVTGVEYPGGYNWKHDIGSDAEGAVLFLMKNGKRILELPVGEAEEVSADADMHRLIGGNLFSDFSSDTETVIKKNGQEICRFSGQEMLTDICEHEGTYHTISSPRAGSGWVYRRDGEVILFRGAGRVLGGLFRDEDGRVCFIYEDIIVSGDSSVKRYYAVTEGRAIHINLPDDIEGIDDAGIIEGRLHYIAQIKGVATRILYNGAESHALACPQGYLAAGGEIVYGGGDILAVAELINATTWEQGFMGIWKNGTPEEHEQGLRFATVCADGTGYSFIAQKKIEGVMRNVVYDGKESIVLPQECGRLYLHGCIARDRERTVAILNGENDRPVLWDRGQVIDYDFNGCFTSVAFI